MEGTYPLPEAQLDRFFFKLKVMYPPEEAMHEILDRTTRRRDDERCRASSTARNPRDARTSPRSVPIARPVQALRDPAGARHASRTRRTRRRSSSGTCRYGASPRAAQAIVLAAKIQALNRGQAFVSLDDVRAVALPALRHRILLNFEGEADEVSTDAIVDELLATVATE